MAKNLGLRNRKTCKEENISSVAILGRKPGTGDSRFEGIWNTVTADHRSVSRIHAVVFLGLNENWYVGDYSLNGTFVNGAKVTPDTRDQNFSPLNRSLATMLPETGILSLANSVKYDIFRNHPDCYAIRIDPTANAHMDPHAGEFLDELARRGFEELNGMTGQEVTPSEVNRKLADTIASRCHRNSHLMVYLAGEQVAKTKGIITGRALYDGSSVTNRDLIRPEDIIAQLESAPGYVTLFVDCPSSGIYKKGSDKTLVITSTHANGGREQISFRGGVIGGSFTKAAANYVKGQKSLFDLGDMVRRGSRTLKSGQVSSPKSFPVYEPSLKY